MKVFTDLDTISAAWTLLDEIGLSGLLTGKALQIDPEELLRNLLVKRKLVEFMVILTHEELAVCSKMTFVEVVPVLGDFFTSMSNDLAGLKGLMRADIMEREPVSVLGMAESVAEIDPETGEPSVPSLP
ncbi:MAG TPA: hypothetical protein PL124_09710 [Candidatus Cloacimonadota bacterium]|nr:hypothetical protein [Candidatus Cloacimonadota bacterium]HPS39675.1 hypothetical protein [Candidatus Cloacimonadota bacterium]